MRAVDTNILTRYFRQDDSRQSPAALRVMRERVFCPKTVILEFEWVMRDDYSNPASSGSGALLRSLRAWASAGRAGSSAP